MNRNFKTMLTGAAVALGLVSTAALAQQADRAPQDAGSHMNMDSEAGAEETMPRGEMMEMMQDFEHSAYAIESAVSTGLPVWVGYSCKFDGAGTAVTLLDGRDEKFAASLERLLPIGG